MQEEWLAGSKCLDLRIMHQDRRNTADLDSDNGVGQFEFYIGIGSQLPHGLQQEEAVQNKVAKNQQ